MSRLSKEHPFPGLRPFEAADRLFFFGRNEQILGLYRLFELSRFIAVIGSSGSGKSSLVRAGLLPLLEDESHDVAAGGRNWRIVTMTPGNAPMTRLAEAVLEIAPNAPLDEISRDLRSSRFGISRALDQIGELDDTHLIILVDQFEGLILDVEPGVVA